MTSRREVLDFHIKNQDYFGTLATVLSLVSQTPEINKKQEEVLKSIIANLLVLQKEYKIIKNRVIK